jgi:TolA-binding protein
MHKALILLFILASISWSCKKSSGIHDPALTGLESSFNTTPNEENYEKLVTKYLEIIQTVQKNTDVSEILLKASNASEKMAKKDQQVIFLNNLVKNYPDRPDTKDNIYKMINLLHATGRHVTADVMSLSYLKTYSGDAKTEELKSKLPKVVSPEDYILDIGRSIFADTATGFNQRNAMNYVDACEAYAMVMPKDPQTPEFIFKAAETSNTLRTFEKSFALYDWLIEKYPSHERSPVALFMKGFLFDGTLHDSTNAAKYYQEFLDKYPENQFAKDAKMLLQNLGKTDEEVLKDLMEKNKENK